MVIQMLILSVQIQSEVDSRLQNGTGHVFELRLTWIQQEVVSCEDTQQLYKSISNPKKKKNEREVLPTPAEKQKIKLPQVIVERGRKAERPRFYTFYRAPDAAEAEMLFVKNGKYPKERFKNPTPHNFRPLEEDVPDFITRYDRDSGHLRIKLRTMDTIQTSSPTRTVKRTESKMDTFRPAEPQWDPRLLLPTGPWPPKSASYTRHRRRRGAYSAFLERVEDKLTRSWQKL
ncbi:uncharacterized protein si:dkey-30e9.6 [Periophthalmus magnuspinnatus]|uniref:uncharacterized protein si:dkey-30e9.6 n=1 Tax=Periophthalmus magnuspinnatus TaxID=409849 RepID=UPI002436F09E|nr:uncharacterized protein si:dkey-30e9.6 [Periophthalmus magnuspinnatus]